VFENDASARSTNLSLVLCDLDLWHPDPQSWSFHAVASKLVHSFSKYCIDKFGSTWMDRLKILCFHQPVWHGRGVKSDTCLWFLTTSPYKTYKRQWCCHESQVNITHVLCLVRPDWQVFSTCLFISPFICLVHVARAWNDQLWGCGGQRWRSHETEDRFEGISFDSLIWVGFQVFNVS